MAKDDFGQIGESYHEAKRALSDSIMKGKSGLYSFADRRSGSGRYETFSDRAERTLLNLLEKSDEEEVMAWIERSFMQLEEDPKAGFTELEFFYREILHIFRKHIGKKGGTRLEWEFPDPTSELRKIANPKELLEQLRVQLRQIIAALNADAERSTQDIVEAVKRFIDENYAEELTLQWVADTYPIHPNYFSRCFKQYWGISFNDYLTRIRIERARALLQSTELKISTISRLVGYEDQNYFCNVFKKQTGISPSAFRNQHPE